MSDRITTDGVAGLRVQHNHPVTRALSDLRKAHGLSGVVLLTFSADGEEVSTTSSAVDEQFGAILERVSDMLLAKLNAGEFDAALPATNGAARENKGNP